MQPIRADGRGRALPTADLTLAAAPPGAAAPGDPQWQEMRERRGEADVALVPADTSLDSFMAREDGSVVGLFNDHGERLKVIEVNAKQHPKVDPKGAHDLASAMITP